MRKLSRWFRKDTKKAQKQGEAIVNMLRTKEAEKMLQDLIDSKNPMVEEAVRRVQDVGMV